MGNFKNENNFFKSIPIGLVYDSTLSDRARFVYVFMACKPEGWEFFLEPMSKEIGYGIETLRKYINELVANGWLIKGEQKNENGTFGAVSYRLPCYKNTVTENFRDGKIMSQEDVDNNKDNNKKEKTNDKKKELFEECWITYRRKGLKKKAYEQWCKLTESEKELVMPHIKAYIQVRERVYQKDFERYLRDKVFENIVVSGNNIMYDPSKLEKGQKVSERYMPQTNYTLMYNDELKCYLYTGFWDGNVFDGYTDETRPDGATVVLNNARGTARWSRERKVWDLEKE